MNHRYHFQKYIIRKCMHFRPVYNVWSKFNFNRRICLADTIKDTVIINGMIKIVFRFCKVCINICCCRQISLIRSRCRNRTSIHKCNRSNLSIRNFRSLAVREVPCRMTDTKSLVAWHIAGTKTWTAESGTNGSSCFHQISNASIFHKFHENRL